VRKVGGEGGKREGRKKTREEKGSVRKPR